MKDMALDSKDTKESEDRLKKYRDKAFLRMEDMAVIYGVSRSQDYTIVDEAALNNLYTVCVFGSTRKMRLVHTVSFFKWYDSLAA